MTSLHMATTLGSPMEDSTLTWVMGDWLYDTGNELGFSFRPEAEYSHSGICGFYADPVGLHRTSTSRKQ